jgi:hypothetical protein
VGLRGEKHGQTLRHEFDASPAASDRQTRAGAGHP